MHIVSNLPTASVGSVFVLVAMILPGIAILTTEMCFKILLMSWLYLQENLW